VYSATAHPNQESELLFDHNGGERWARGQYETFARRLRAEAKNK
jgi:hypothetical protein